MQYNKEKGEIIIKERRKLRYYMGKEKIEQNIERVYSFLFSTLGCNEEDAKKILEGVIKKLKDTSS